MNPGQRLLRERLANATPAALDQAAEMALAEAFGSEESPRGNQLLLLAALARAIANTERDLIAQAKRAGAAHYHVGPLRVCFAEDHTRSVMRELAGLACEPPTGSPT